MSEAGLRMIGFMFLLLAGLGALIWIMTKDE